MVVSYRLSIVTRSVSTEAVKTLVQAFISI